MTFAERESKIGSMKEEEGQRKGKRAPPIFSLIRILSWVFSTERGLDMSGFINCSRKYYWPGPSAPFLPAAVNVSALLPPHSSGVLPGHITGHCGTAWKLEHTVSSLTLRLAWASFYCSCKAPHTCSLGETKKTHFASLWGERRSVQARFGEIPAFRVG